MTRLNMHQRIVDKSGALTTEGLQMLQRLERQAAFVGTVTSVTGTGTASGLSLSGTVTASGSLTLSGAVTWVDVSGKPATFPPEAHTQAWSTITTTPTTLAGYGITDAAALAHTHTAGDVSGLGTLATQNGTFSGTSSGTNTGDNAVNSLYSGLVSSRFGLSPMRPAAGEFLGNGLNAIALTVQAQVANRTVIAPFVQAYDVTIDQLGVSVSTFGAAQNAKAIIYAADANGRPSTVLRETANISAGANGTFMSAITPLDLVAGTTYWRGIRASGIFTVRAIGVGATWPLTYTAAATPVAEGTLILTETFATAAATWSYAASQHSNVLVPLILMRVA